MVLSKLRRVEPVSVALVFGLINAAIGLIFGISGFFLTSFLARNPDIAEALVQSGLSIGIAGTSVASVNSALGLIILYPIVGFIGGFISTLAVAWLYNLIAKKLPVKFEIK